MKHLPITVLLIISVLNVNAQTVGNKFNYLHTQCGSYQLTPISERNRNKGSPTLTFWADENYAIELFYGIVKQVFSKEFLDTLNLGSGFVLDFDSTGKALSCYFNISEKDINLIPEDDLYILYEKFKELKIDMKMVLVCNEVTYMKPKKFEYFTIVGSLLPIEYRDWDEKKMRDDNSIIKK